LGACRISQSQKPNSALGSNHIADVVVIPVAYSVHGHIAFVEGYVTGRKEYKTAKSCLNLIKQKRS